MLFYRVSRDEAKKLFIMLLYFGKFENWAKANELDEIEPLEFILLFQNTSIQSNLIFDNGIYNRRFDRIALFHKRKD
jgi:hypothetical protein